MYPLPNLVYLSSLIYNRNKIICKKIYKNAKISLHFSSTIKMAKFPPKCGKLSSPNSNI